MTLLAHGPEFDEHGELTEESLPTMLGTDEAVRRWRVCLGLASRLTGGQPHEAADVQMAARALYASDVPTGDSSALNLSEAYDEAMHPRGRRGQWIKKLGLPTKITSRLPSLKNTPGLTSERNLRQAIKDAGLDRPPQPTAATREVLGGFNSTADRFAAGKPSPGSGPTVIPYTAERTARHDRIRDELFAGKTPPAGEPRAHFLAGGPASGKSTLIREHPEVFPPQEHTVHIDVDQIKAQLPEYGELRDAGDHYAASAVHEESGDIAARLLHEALERGFNVVVDGTGDGAPGQFVRQLGLLRERGHHVDLTYVNVPTDKAIAGSLDRAQQSGRYVPIEVVRQQHAAVSRVWRDEVLHLPWVQRLAIYDDGHLIAGHDEATPLEVLDQERYDAFMDKAAQRLDAEAQARWDAIRRGGSGTEA